MGSLASTDDSDVEEAPTEHSSTSDSSHSSHDRSSGEKGAPDKVCRAPRDKSTVWHNEYFKLTDNRMFDNCRMRILDRWASEKLLGVRYRSKTIPPKRYGESRTCPELTYIALRAWMLWRMQWYLCRFLLSKRARMEVWVLEAHSLRWHIFARGGPEALPEAARSDIKIWAPRSCNMTPSSFHSL